MNTSMISLRFLGFVLLFFFSLSLSAQETAFQKLKTISTKTDLSIRLKAISEVVEEYPQYAFAYHAKGHAFYKLHQYDSAYVYLKKALSFPSPEPFYHNLMANCLRKLDQIDLALDHYQLALDIDPKFYPAILDRAQYYLENGDHEELDQSLEALIEWDDQIALIYFIRGTLKLESLDFDGMRADIDKVLDLALLQLEVYDRLAKWNEEQGMLNYPEERQEWERMISQIALAATLMANLPEQLTNEALQQDNIVRSKPNMQEKLGPYNENLSGEKVSIQEINRLSNAGLEYFRAGDLQEALIQYEKILHYYPQHQEALKYQKEIKALLD